MKVRIPHHLVDASIAIDLAVREDIEPHNFAQAFNTCQRIISGVQVTWKERCLMLSNLIQVNGKPLTPGEWAAMLHDDWQMMQRFCQLAGNWIVNLCEEGK